MIKAFRTQSRRNELDSRRQTGERADRFTKCPRLDDGINVGSEDVVGAPVNAVLFCTFDVLLQIFVDTRFGSFSTNSVAFIKAKRTPLRATSLQSISLCQCETSIPGIIVFLIFAYH